MVSGNARWSVEFIFEDSAPQGVDTPSRQTAKTIEVVSREVPVPTRVKKSKPRVTTHPHTIDTVGMMLGLVDVTLESQRRNIILFNGDHHHTRPSPSTRASTSYETNQRHSKGVASSPNHGFLAPGSTYSYIPGSLPLVTSNCGRRHSQIPPTLPRSILTP